MISVLQWAGQLEQKMRLLSLVLLIIEIAGHTYAQSAAPVDKRVVLEISIAGNQREFHMGETIPIQLGFSSAVPRRYEINMAQYDRSGRMNYERFKISPADSAVDPLQTLGGLGSLGGLTSYKYLNAEPWTITLNLNEWVRFTRPGYYRLVVSSGRVVLRDSSTPTGTSPVVVLSNEIKLKIISADAKWQKDLLGELVSILNAKPPAKPEENEKYWSLRRAAFEKLRFLGTADAARELAKRMRGEDDGRTEYICMLGLIASPERDAALAALAKALEDPDQPISGTFLYALRMLRVNPGSANANWREEQTRVLEELIRVLPFKRSQALSVSLSTAVNMAWNDNSLPQTTMDLMVRQLVAMFDQLPLNQQNLLLGQRWNKITSPALLPILRLYAHRYQDYPEMRESSAYDNLQLSAMALRRWYELDPADARPAFIKEITRPRPRFGARVLGVLPEESLPEVDEALAEHFLASKDLDGSSNLASLIARYATDSILPQILERLDQRVGKWACDIQNPILAYVLRVDPNVAGPRIERAIMARGEGFSACNHGLFQTVSEIRNDPILEEIAIRSLDDSDPEVAMTAATMLGNVGSPKAEAALWQRYVSWTTQWSGHESQLARTMADGIDESVYQLGLGNNLLQALATGKSWLADKAMLERIQHVTTVRSLQERLAGYLGYWKGQPLPIIISISTFDSFTKPSLQVAQYEVHSINDLKSKLSQFPRGTAFVLEVRSDNLSENQQLIDELRTFLTGAGMTVSENKPDR
jgi:hypothetical protein